MPTAGPVACSKRTHLKAEKLMITETSKRLKNEALKRRVGSERLNKKDLLGSNKQITPLEQTSPARKVKAWAICLSPTVMPLDFMYFFADDDNLLSHGGFPMTIS